MKLSDRLQVMADLINPGETVADIGTDHGFLPIYLTEQGISPHVILTDISQGSLAKARGNCLSHDPERAWDLRIGDGLAVLSPGEVDMVVIAGMGGLLIADMIEQDLALSRSFSGFILQPRNNIGRLRYRLQAAGLHIERECLVQERKRICEILLVRPDKALSTGNFTAYEESPEQYEFPGSLVAQAGPLTREYLERALQKQLRNLSLMASARNEQEEVAEKTRKTIARLEELIKEVTEREQGKVLQDY
jgi:tRNA (adenine22-N1)-methyltransferase